MSFGGLFGALGVSASGLNAERMRMEVTANNVANAFSTRTADGGPFRRQDVVFAAVLDEQSGSKASMGGVEAVEVVDDPTPARVVSMPGHPDADAQGNVSLPNVDLPMEMVNLVTATRAYEANVRTAQAFVQMSQQALAIVR
jgi:flagellar basal-body rod protein FlgC